MTGVSHLFVVPQLRSSKYLSSLATVAPSLLSVPKAGETIGGSELSSLRSLIVVNNMDTEADFRAELDSIPAAVDFREILRWHEPRETESRVPLTRDDVMNIQFTR